MTTSRKAPWHLWLVGILALVFNAGAANDYLMLKFNNASYRAALSEAQLAHYDAYPVWMSAAWAMTVWFAVLGAIMLLLRKRIAAGCFALSSAAYLVALTYTYSIADPAPGVLSDAGNIFAAIMGAHLIALWLYSRRMFRIGVLGKF